MKWIWLNRLQAVAALVLVFIGQDPLAWLIVLTLCAEVDDLRSAQL